MSIHCKALKQMVPGYRSKLPYYGSHFKSAASAFLSPFGPMLRPRHICALQSDFLECPSFTLTFSPDSNLSFPVRSLSIWLIQFCALENGQELKIVAFGGHLGITEIIYTKYKNAMDIWYWFLILSGHTSFPIVYLKDIASVSPTTLLVL